MKKFTAIIATIALIATIPPPPLLTLNTFAAGVPTVTFSGTGKLTQIVVQAALEAHGGYQTAEVNVVIEGYTSIGYEAFLGCGEVKRVELADTLTEIGIYSFRSMRTLEYIKLPQNLEKIGAGAFYECKALENVTIPNSVTSIESSAFYNWTSSQTINMQHSDAAQVNWEYPPTKPTIVWGYKPPVAGISNSTTPLNVNLRKTVIDISQPTFLSIVINPNTAGLEVISDDYYIQSNNNCPIQVSLVDFGLSDADDSGYQLVAPTAKTWANVPHTEKVLALGIKHNKASELSNGVELIDGDTFWSTDIDEPVAVCQIAAKKRATFELIAQHGYSVDNDRTLTVEIVPVITLAPPIVEVQPVVYSGQFLWKDLADPEAPGTINYGPPITFTLTGQFGASQKVITTDENGYFELTDLEEGLYMLDFYMYTESGGSATLTVGDGQPRHNEYILWYGE